MTARNDKQPHDAPRCGAKNRRGVPCTAFAMKNGRCRFHGGLSTGPRTPEGKARSRRGNWKHGLYSAQAKRERGEIQRLIRGFKKLKNMVGPG